MDDPKKSVNDTRFIETIESPEMQRLLREPTDLIEWDAGGCWILAAGLQRWLGGKATLAFVGNGHVAARCDDLYYDANGIHTQQQMQSAHRNADIRDFDETVARLTGIPEPDERVTRIAEIFRAKFPQTRE